MPEEVNRVVTDRLSRLLLCPSETAVENLAAEGIRRGVELVGDVMVDLARVLGPVACARSAFPAALGLEPGSYALATVHRQANTERPALARLVEGLARVEGPVVLPLHPRTRAALEAAGMLAALERAATVLPPLGYLDFTALLRAARVCLTDSGGVQKEAYLHSVPCVTLRDTTEWVETVQLGWNVLVERAGRDRGRSGGTAARGNAPGGLRRRPRGGADGPSGGRNRLAHRLGCSLVDARIAVIGAGYVGLPLAVAFAEAGHAVLCVEPDAPRVARINAGDSYIKDVSAETLDGARAGGSPARHGRLRRGGGLRRRDRVRAHAADRESRARPLVHHRPRPSRSHRTCAAGT